MSLETETMTGTNVKQSVPFFMVSNMEESVRYCIDGLGFKMINKWMDEGKLRWLVSARWRCSDAAGVPKGRPRFLGA